ncbi:MAG: NADH-quinone oxidoreductase subunit C [Firmicutes bacterium]|nr:NADH-quinone oxidoreductase subunit C [Bacillota bacterium]
MSDEETLVNDLLSRFGFASASVQRERRVWAEVPRERFIEVLTWLHDERGFTSLCTVTGLDAADSFQLIYHLADNRGVILSVKESAPKSDPVFDTALDIYKGGALYELEARNLLGLVIKSAPEDIRYPLPDHWPQGEYPLRKDWVSPESKKEQAEPGDPAAGSP